ncbi:MAG TPA: hypothetical protein VLF94_07450 [Chlamydiales bacterium]|nr:hypothetical protein [Chlamydiales bacterium]
MHQLQLDLQAELQAGDQSAAEATIGKLQVLDNSLNLESRGVKFDGAYPLTPYLFGSKGLMNQLNQMLTDVKKGDFSDATSANHAVGDDLMAVFAILAG